MSEGKKRGPKPKLEITEHHYAEIENMAGLGLPTHMIARIFGVSPTTLDTYLAKDEKLHFHFHKGVALATKEVAQTAFSQAVTGANPAMTMFWLKCRANWKETKVHEVKQTTIEDLVNGAAEKDVSPKVLEMVKKESVNE